LKDKHTLYIALALRWGDPNGHQYTVEASYNKYRSSIMGKFERSYRGGKYEYDIIEIKTTYKCKKIFVVSMEKKDKYNKDDEFYKTKYFTSKKYAEKYVEEEKPFCTEINLYEMSTVDTPIEGEILDELHHLCSCGRLNDGEQEILRFHYETVARKEHDEKFRNQNKFLNNCK